MSKKAAALEPVEAAMTPAVGGDRHDPRVCGARKRQGEGLCGQAAGWGTDHPGSGRCKLHGGRTAAQGTNVARRQVEEQAREVLAELGAPAVGDPLEALLLLGGQVLAWQRATAELVNRLESVRYRSANGSEQVRAEVVVYERAMDRACTVLSAIARLNIEERLARVSERQADAVVAAVEAGLASAGVTGAAAVEARKVVARRLRVLSPVPFSGPGEGA
jgi:hypothetical protein